MSRVVTVERLRKVFRLEGGDRLVAVAEASFRIDRGEVLGLIGESGSGKSTVGRCLAGLLAPDGGTITWGTDDAQVGMVFQEPRDSVNRRFQVWEAIADPLLAHGVRRGAELATRVEEAAALVGLDRTHLLLNCDGLPEELLQRASIARALILEPDLLILDEPTTALDPDARAGVLELIKRLRGSSSTAILLISHDLLAIRSVTERVAIMYLGKIVERGPTDRLFVDPLHPYTRALMQSALELDPSVPMAPVELIGEIPSPMERPPGCPLEPRCPWSIAACSEAEPPEEDYGDKHSVSCIRSGEFAADTRLLARSTRPRNLVTDQAQTPGTADGT